VHLYQTLPDAREKVVFEQLLYRNMQRFQGGLVLKAHRLCVSLNSRLESNKEKREAVHLHQTQPDARESAVCQESEAGFTAGCERVATFKKVRIISTEAGFLLLDSRYRS